jgi:carbohydrate kinase (thermoresistant glucokinase family)
MRIVVIGVAGSGKTTVGEGLAARLGIPFFDADTLHTPEAVEQMRRGEPLTDAERDAWFDRVVAAMRARDPVVVACSALRRAHRDRLRSLGDARMFLLEVPTAELERRLRERAGHYFPASLLQSQIHSFDPPEDAEGIVAIDADRPEQEIVDAIAAELAPAA